MLYSDRRIESTMVIIMTNRSNDFDKNSHNLSFQYVNSITKIRKVWLIASVLVYTVSASLDYQQQPNSKIDSTLHSINAWLSRGVCFLIKPLRFKVGTIKGAVCLPVCKWR